jgi:hypothetical protein
MDEDGVGGLGMGWWGAFDQAGGVGKTTVAQSHGCNLARRGHKKSCYCLWILKLLTAFMGVNTETLKLSVTTP